MANEIVCPNCNTKIEITEAFSAQVEEKLRAEFNQRYKEEKQKLTASLKQRAEEEAALKLKDLEQQVTQKGALLREAQEKELQWLQRQRELEEREQSFRLELERQLADERQRIFDDATARLAEEHRLKDAEKEKTLSDLKKQLEELRRRAEQGSQQTQGEVLELELENVLRASFRYDDIQPVPKGIRGADVIQAVRTPQGGDCGSIIWESKRQKNWSDAWIQKLKEDQREVSASIAVIVSTVLPRDVVHFGSVDGVWVCDFTYAVEMATVLRAGMVEITQAKNALVGRNEKMDLVYAYLAGKPFRQKVEAIVESFIALKGDLDAEKRAMEKIWTKRERQLQHVIDNTARMYGDLQGIIGTALPSISTLELPGSDDDTPQLDLK